MTDDATSKSFEPRGFPHVTEVSREQIAAFLSERHDFEELFTRLPTTHSDLAQFVLSRTEQISPGNIQHKQSLARLALEIIGLLDSQAEANELNTIYSGFTEQTPPAA